MSRQPTRPCIETTNARAGRAESGELSSDALLGGRRELVIRHGDETYRLRLTRQNKLILTK